MARAKKESSALFEIRIHGRGGQGAVLASLALARAAFRRGFFVQAFPEFGVERRGAPVAAYLRLSRSPIYLRTRIYTPDCVLVLDPSLLANAATLEGLKPKGTLVANWPDKKSLPVLAQDAGEKWHLAAADGSVIAADLGIGSKAAPIGNTAMCGAFVKATDFMGMEDLSEALSETFAENAGKNIEAALRGYDQCRILN